MVKIVFVGVGGWISDPYLGFASVLVEAKNSSILIDAGEGVYKALKLCGYDVDNLNVVVITHRHGDHILGFPTLALTSMHKGIKKLKVVTHKDVVDSIVNLFKIIGIEYALDIIDFVLVKPGDSLELSPFTLYFTESMHTVPSIFTKIYVEDKCIAYSGDTRYNPSIVEFIKNCDVLIHEVADYSSKADLYGHTNYVDAMKIASEAHVKIFVPIHFYQRPLPIDVEPLMNKLKIFVPMPCAVLEI